MKIQTLTKSYTLFHNEYMDSKEKLPEDPLKDFAYDLEKMHIEQIFPHHPFHIGRVFILVLLFGLVAAVAGTTGYLLGRSEEPLSQCQAEIQTNIPIQAIDQ